MRTFARRSIKWQHDARAYETGEQQGCSNGSEAQSDLGAHDDAFLLIGHVICK